MESTLASNSLVAENDLEIGVHYHSWLYVVFRIKPRTSHMLGKLCERGWEVERVQCGGR